MHPKFMDDGLTKAYALYWASATRLQVPVFGHFHSIFFTSRSTRLAFLHGEIDESNSIQNFKSFQIYSILLTLHDACQKPWGKLLGSATWQRQLDMWPAIFSRTSRVSSRPGRVEDVAR